MNNYNMITRALTENRYCWLVTGAAGFIGSHICKRLRKEGQHVVALDNLATGSLSNLEPLLNDKDFRFIESDLSDNQKLLSVAIGADFILHQAALGSVPRSIEHPDATFESNVAGFHNVLLAAKNASVKRVVYASSSSVYGDSPELPKREHVVGNVLSPYALSKKVNEEYAKIYASVFNMSVVGLRYFNVFGPFQNPEGPYAAVIPRWIESVVTNEEISINGDGTYSRDFCYVDNVVNANLLAALSDLTPGAHVYNVSCGDRVSLQELFEEIMIVAKENSITYDFDQAKYGDVRKGDVPHSQADISLATKELGYQPVCFFKDGLRKTFSTIVESQ